MNQYSHYYLAMHLAQRVQPEDPAEYAWGAMAADVRYVSKMRREQTHRPIAEITGWLEEFPALRSFVLGYRVHCLLDQIDASGILLSTFPLSVIKHLSPKPITRKPALMMIEVYFLRKPEFADMPPVSGVYNPILERMGVSREACETYVEVVREYLGCRSQASVIDNVTDMASRLGLMEDERIQGYVGAARAVLSSRVALLPLLWSVRRANFERRAEDLLKS